MANEVATKKTEPKPPLAAGGRVAAIVPQNIDECWRVAKAFLTAGTVPDVYLKNATAEQAVSRVISGIMAGAEVGLPPMMSLKCITIINGMPALWGDGPMALIQKAGVLESFHEEWTGEPGADGWTCTVTMKRKGQEEPFVSSFSVADAKAAGLWGKAGPWKQYPKRMLFNRARAFACRNGFADCLMGLQIVEDIQDVEVVEKREAPDLAFLDDDPTVRLTASADVTPTEEDVTSDEAETAENRETAGEDVTSGEETDPAAAKCAEIVAALEAAGDLGEVNAVIRDAEPHMEALTDEQVKEIKAAHIAAMKRTEEALTAAEVP